LIFGEKASWASMTTVVAAIFTAFTAATIYPEERPYFSKEEMAGFILFFAVLLGFAPVVYNFARREKAVVAKDEAASIAKEPHVQGYVWTFLVASALILGALLGSVCLSV
jgi:NADH:ubiquinone oxidoreductase subunit 6 (subunit J)